MCRASSTTRRLPLFFAACVLTAQGRRHDDRRRGTFDNGTRKNWPFQNALRVDLVCSSPELLGLVGASPADRRMRSSKTGRSGAAKLTISPLIQLPIARKTPRRSSSALRDVLQLSGASFSHSRRPCPLISLHLAVSPFTVVPSKPRSLAAPRRYPLHPPPPPQLRLRHLQRSTMRPALNHFAPPQLDHSRT